MLSSGLLKCAQGFVDSHSLVSSTASLSAVALAAGGAALGLADCSMTNFLCACHPPLIEASKTRYNMLLLAVHTEGSRHAPFSSSSQAL